MNPVSNGITSSPSDSGICQDGRQRVPLIMFVPNLTLSKPMHTISGTNSRTPELRVSRFSTPHGSHVTRIYVCIIPRTCILSPDVPVNLFITQISHTVLFSDFSQAEFSDCTIPAFISIYRFSLEESRVSLKVESDRYISIIE